MTWPCVPAFYYPTNDTSEPDSAYRAWRDHYTRQPVQMACYATPAYSTWQCQPVISGLMPAWHVPQPCYYPGPWPAVMKEPETTKENKAGGDDDDSDSEWNTAPTRPAHPENNAPLADKKKKKKKKQEPEFVMRYVPAGQRPDGPDGLRADGRFHYTWAGRSSAAIQKDRHAQAIDAGVYKAFAKIPDASGSDQLWVVDQSTGQSKLEKFADIRDKLEGRWEIDERFNSHYFLKTGVKGPSGWD